MTEAQVKEMLDEMKIEYRYHHFETEEAIEPPFLVWVIPNTKNFKADGKAYYSVKNLDIELYTDKKDISLEGRIEMVLDQHGIYWNKEEEYIESENMYEVLYEMEV